MRLCWRPHSNPEGGILSSDMGAPSANPYAQLFLGFRSLAVKILIFVVMAALLAWALGGTLWPRSQIRMVGDAISTSQGRYVLTVKTGEGTHGVFALAGVDEDGRLKIEMPQDGQPLWHFALPPVTNGTDIAVAFRSGTTWMILIHGQTRKTVRVADQAEAAAWLKTFAAGSAKGSSSAASAGPN